MEEERNAQKKRKNNAPWTIAVKIATLDGDPIESNIWHKCGFSATLFFACLQLSIGLQIIFQCNWCQIVIVQNMFNVLCTSNYCQMKQMLWWILDWNQSSWASLALINYFTQNSFYIDWISDFEALILFDQPVLILCGFWWIRVKQKLKHF